MEITFFNTETGRKVSGTTKRLGKKSVTLIDESGEKFIFTKHVNGWKCNIFYNNVYELGVLSTIEYGELIEKYKKILKEYKKKILEQSIRETELAIEYKKKELENLQETVNGLNGVLEDKKKLLAEIE